MQRYRIAHGHSAHLVDEVKTLKRNFPKVDVVAGNVVTAKGATDLAKAGADAIKAGLDLAEFVQPDWLPESACRR